jgi:F0F1-type ATP synthase membrane subunit b/b'
MNSIFLQIFLLVNVFLIGAIATIAVQHAYAHFKPQPHEDEKPQTQPHPQAQVVHLPPEVRNRLLQVSQANFQNVLDHSAAELEHNLKGTATQLNKHLEKLGTEIINGEMKRYRASLDELRSQTSDSIANAQVEVAKHQAELRAEFIKRQTELEAKLTGEIAAEKQRLTQQIDTKLSDTVASFLIETLQHNVDLGAQSTYLTTMLEEHKAEIAKGIADET